ncbi:hypothetical protein [Nonomuraea dietziae]|uniref:hypothetical protein n=1 Tax=Nonomuraea dietziae TaxID=65515 RepID=UPI0031D3975B
MPASSRSRSSASPVRRSSHHMPPLPVMPSMVCSSSSCIFLVPSPGEGASATLVKAVSPVR